MSEPRPFDLAKAIAGEPIQTRDGRKVRLIAHVPEAHPAAQIIVIDEEGGIPFFRECNGKMVHNLKSGGDLVMAPRKVQIWTRAYRSYESGRIYAVSGHSKTDDHLHAEARDEWLDPEPILHGEYDE